MEDSAVTESIEVPESPEKEVPEPLTKITQVAQDTVNKQSEKLSC